MKEFYSTTLKYFRLAITEFLPKLKELQKEVKLSEQKKKLDGMIEAYEDIAKKIDRHNLNLEDPNKFYDGEQVHIKIDIPESIIEELARLSIRLLGEWKNQHVTLKEKPYLTEDNQDKIYELEHLIWPLEALSKEGGDVLGKYSKMGPLEFPGEFDRELVMEDEKTGMPLETIFPDQLLRKIPDDVTILCHEFNFNYKHYKPHACVLLLRRMLPLAIVRKFERIGRSAELKNIDDEYLDTMALLGKMESLLSDKRLYKRVKSYKKNILDGSQHSYSLRIEISDAHGAAIAIRCLLDDIYEDE